MGHQKRGGTLRGLQIKRDRKIAEELLLKHEDAELVLITSEVVLCPILYCIDVFSTYLGKILDFVVVHWSFIFVSHVSWLIVEFI